MTDRACHTEAVTASQVAITQQECELTHRLITVVGQVVELLRAARCAGDAYISGELGHAESFARYVHGQIGALHVRWQRDRRSDRRAGLARAWATLGELSADAGLLQFLTTATRSETEAIRRPAQMITVLFDIATAAHAVAPQKEIHEPVR